jgi:glycosyltransferase involved in cell wall biosynthesis
VEGDQGLEIVNPLRVVMVVRLFYPWVGGAERQAHKLARELRKKNIQTEIVTGWWFRGTPKRELLDGIPVTRNHTLWHMFDLKGLRWLGGYLYILTLLWYLWRRRASYDLIHVHSLSYHAFAATLAGRWFHRKTIVKLANSGPASDISKMRRDKHLPFAHLMLPAALGCDRLVATNELIARELIAEGVPAERIARLSNGVETDSIEARSDYALNGPVRIIFAGRLHEQKGLDVLLRAFRQLLDQRPTLELRLQLLGEGPAKEDLVHLSNQLQIAWRVDFLGQTDQVYETLRQADIFVLPSRAEGTSNALLEAMACGLPVIVSDIPGNVDVVDGETNGLRFSAGDPASLAKAILTLIDRPESRERLGRAARLTVENRYSLGSVADQYIALYQDVLAARSRSASQLDERLIARQDYSTGP